MITFDQSLADLVKQRLVTYEEAVKHSTQPVRLRAAVPRRLRAARAARSGRRSSRREVTGGSSSGAPSRKTNDEFEIDRFGK